MGRHDAFYASCANCESLYVISPHWLNEAHSDIFRSDRLDSGAQWRNDTLLTVTEIAGVIAPTGQWLDYGCGRGLLLQALRRRGHQVDGYDPYREMSLDRGKRYSLIFSYEVLEHQPDPKGFLLEIQSRLVAGGIIMLSTCLREAFHGKSWPYLAVDGGQHVTFASATGMKMIADGLSLRWPVTLIHQQCTDLQVHIFASQRLNRDAMSQLDGHGFSIVWRDV